ncbi:MAG TPA: FliG C-terminal domain-containing protein [Spirochaetia bacterium]|nr:FliG C-terminal domain-containing protein [Spirochaetia bacterium]
MAGRRDPREKKKAPKQPPDPSVRGFIKETSRDAGYRKAARFLMLLGKDEAARVLSHMSAEEVEGITREIARTQHIDEHEAGKILEEFGYITETRTLVAQGGIDKAQEMLTAALGPEKAEKILSEVKKDMAPPPFSFLQDIDAHQAIGLVREESVPVASLILAHLEPKLAGRILQALSPDIQHEVVARIAKLQKVDAEVIRRTEEALRGKVREQAVPVTEEIDGKSALTEILRFMDPGKEQEILKELEPNVSNEIRKKLYTIDIVFQLTDKDLQRVLRDHSDREIAMLTKGVEEKARARIMASMSERRRELVRLESDALGPVRKGDADAALQDFLEYIQVLEQKGELVILREREEFV